MNGKHDQHKFSAEPFFSDSLRDYSKTAVIVLVSRAHNTEIAALKQNL